MRGVLSACRLMLVLAWRVLCDACRLSLPPRWPDKDPERILVEDLHYEQWEVETLHGRFRCLAIACNQFEWLIFDALKDILRRGER